jgi:hypothetical protein
MRVAKYGTGKYRKVYSKGEAQHDRRREWKECIEQSIKTGKGSQDESYQSRKHICTDS